MLIKVPFVMQLSFKELNAYVTFLDHEVDLHKKNRTYSPTQQS